MAKKGPTGRCEGTDHVARSQTKEKNRQSSLASIRSTLSTTNYSDLLRSSWNHFMRGGIHSMRLMPFDTNGKIRHEKIKDARDTEKTGIFVLISSFRSNHQQKSHQDWAFTILEGLHIGPDQIETIDEAAPANKEKRNELFVLSDIYGRTIHPPAKDCRFHDGIADSILPVCSWCDAHNRPSNFWIRPGRKRPGMFPVDCCPGGSRERNPCIDYHHGLVRVFQAIQLLV